MSAHRKAFALYISKRGSTAFWYATSVMGGPAFMACLANAKLFPRHSDAEQAASKLRDDGFDVDIVPVSAIGAVS